MVGITKLCKLWGFKARELLAPANFIFLFFICLFYKIQYKKSLHKLKMNPTQHAKLLALHL